jgi:low affinity Fe/Cu permease
LEEVGMNRGERNPRPESRRSRADLLERSATLVTRWAGSGAGFGIALATIVVWAITGPLFGWSDTWQLVINTGTTIVTFLMVFLIQRSQNKEGMAMHLKLNEVIAAIEGASNRLIDLEDLSERELHVLHAHYRRLADMAAREADIFASHSIDEAEARHESKRAHGEARATRRPRET